MTRLMLEGQFDHELGLRLQNGFWYWLGWHIHMLGKIVQAGLVLCLGVFVWFVASNGGI